MDKTLIKKALLVVAADECLLAGDDAVETIIDGVATGKLPEISEVSGGDNFPFTEVLEIVAAVASIISSILPILIQSQQAKLKKDEVEKIIDERLKKEKKQISKQIKSEIIRYFTDEDS
jgi:hypothetical protein